MKCFLQKPSETLYLPHATLHTAWNISPSLSVGDWRLYETSFDEWIGSGGVYQDRIILKARGQAKSRMMDTIKQVDEAIDKHRILNFTRPEIRICSNEKKWLAHPFCQQNRYGL